VLFVELLVTLLPISLASIYNTYAMGHSLSAVPASQPTISDFPQISMLLQKNKILLKLVKVSQSYGPYKMTTFCGQ